MAVYAVTIFLSALLLFQVQLVIGKYILPWFGGTPAVWTTCMLFFQVLLMAGYAYSHLVATRLASRRQGLLHGALLAVSAALLVGQIALWGTPILPSADWKPDGSALPLARILAILTVGVGLPFFVLSTTSSLVQAWFNRMHPGRSPYRLYALSNAGSLLALLSYPFVVEPSLALRSQAMGWAAGYAVFAVLCGYLAVASARGGARSAGASVLAPAQENVPAPDAAGAPDGEGVHGGARPAVAHTIVTGDRGEEVRPTRLVRTLWLVLPAMGSVLLLATTNRICGDIGVVPLLWVLPLALYLVTFIVCFDRPGWYIRPAFVVAALVAAGGVAFVLFEPTGTLTFLPQVAAYGFALLVGCMICHGELVRLRPPPQHLTAYYLTLAAGGAAGGLFVGVVAPYVFDRLWELYIGYWGTTAALVVAMLRDRRSCLNGPHGWLWRHVARTAVTAVAIASVLAVPHFDPQSVRRVRNFYGILRVTDENVDDPDEHALVLYHGRIMHGSQLQDPELRRRPNTYYTERSGAGLAILNHPARALGPDGRGHMKIGVVGLGTGTLAAYGRKGDTIKFYEINPAVVGLSRGSGASFTYLNDSPANIEIVMGDARLSLEKEPPQQFDVLALDAFSGDAVPVHLLTAEAFKVYLKHLAPDGILAVHTSNTFLNLDRVVQTAADYWNLWYIAVDSPIDKEGVYMATWMLLTRSDDVLNAPDILMTFTNAPVEPARLWTDDYSNLLEVLR